MNKYTIKDLRNWLDGLPDDCPIIQGTNSFGLAPIKPEGGRAFPNLDDEWIVTAPTPKQLKDGYE